MPTIEDLRDSKYVLPEDAVLSPVSSLPKGVRALIDSLPDDFAFTRRYARNGTKVLSNAAGRLLEEFRAPTTFLDAIVRYSDAIGKPPVAVLDAAGMLLLDLVNQDCLMQQGSSRVSESKPSLANGDTFEGHTVIDCRQLLDDTEVYKVSNAAGELMALKIAREGHVSPFLKGLFEREGQILRHLGGKCSPRLDCEGEFGERPYLIMEWIEGFPLGEAIEMYHKKASNCSGKERDRINRERLGIAVKVADAYAKLHSKGVLHGDVHPHNIVLLPDGSVRLIDFGYARLMSDEETPPRAGVPIYYEPEFAKAVRDGGYYPPASEPGEQYSVAAIIYQLVSDEQTAHGKYLPSAMEQKDLLNQIVESTPLPLTSYFVTYDEELEWAVLKALSKEPKDRHASMADFRRELVSAKARIAQKGLSPVETLPRSSAREANLSSSLLQRFKELARPGGRWYTHAFNHSPSCSVNYGAAGISYALYRLSAIQEDPDLLAQADLWITKATAHERDPRAFYSREIAINKAAVGPVSPYHNATGVQLVQAMVAGALGQPRRNQEALERFVTLSEIESHDNLDLTLGKTAVLLGCSIAVEHFEQSQYLDLRSVVELGQRTSAAIWGKLATVGPIADCKETEYLGIAHGWAGFCYGTLRWCQAIGRPVPENLHDRLEELAAMSKQNGAGAAWPYSVGQGSYASGWCNGHAGWAFLWTEAARAFSDPRYERLAIGAAESAWQDRGGVDSLCCGAAGKAYAMMNLFRFTGDAKWRRRAEKLGGSAISQTNTGYSLYKSMTGVAVMAADLEDPQNACMPLFERESPRDR